MDPVTAGRRGVKVPEPLLVESVRQHRRLRAVVVREGDDLVVTVSGGDRPHVGCVVLAVPARTGKGRRTVTVSMLTVPPHREEAVARPMAESLAGALGGVVLVSAGVHEDGATPDAIADWLDLARDLTARIVELLAP